MQDLVVGRGVTRVGDHQSLVDRLVRTASREGDLLGRVHLHHRNEGLGARRERVTDHPEVVAEGRVDVLAHGVFVLRLLD